MRELEGTLLRLDGRGYKAYKDLQSGISHFPDFEIV